MADRATLRSDPRILDKLPEFFRSGDPRGVCGVQHLLAVHDAEEMIRAIILL
jgi:hypothetical protein